MATREGTRNLTRFPVAAIGRGKQRIAQPREQVQAPCLPLHEDRAGIRGRRGRRELSHAVRKPRSLVDALTEPRERWTCAAVVRGTRGQGRVTGSGGREAVSGVDDGVRNADCSTRRGLRALQAVPDDDRGNADASGRETPTESDAWQGLAHRFARLVGPLQRKHRARD